MTRGYDDEAAMPAGFIPPQELLTVASIMENVPTLLATLTDMIEYFDANEAAMDHLWYFLQDRLCEEHRGKFGAKEMMETLRDEKKLIDLFLELVPPPHMDHDHD